jgi:flagellin
MTSINTNIGAMVAQKNMMENTKDLDNAMARISSGLRINSAADDAAGSAIASKMDTQVKSLGVAIRNANDAISLTQTAEGALGEVENILQRMRELSVQAGNSTLNTSDRSQIQSEMDQLAAEIDSISSKTNFNDVKLLDGSRNSVTMQIGVNATDSLDIKLQGTSVSALNIGTSNSVSNGEYITQRVLAIPDMTASDVKLNGKDIFGSTLDISTTLMRGAAGDHSGDPEGDAADNGQFIAIALADKINTNSTQHGVVASSFNNVTSTTGVYTSENIIINGITVTAKTSAAAFMDAVNNQVHEVQVSINDAGLFEFTNDGATLEFGTNSLGIAADEYGGFVKLTSTNGLPISIEAGSADNGYTGGAGNLADLVSLGMNQQKVNDTGGITYTANAIVDNDVVLQASSGIYINDVLIDKAINQTATSGSAVDKTTAINQYTSETGVVATANTKAVLTLDFNGSTKANHDNASINGVTVDLSGATAISTSGVATLINTAMAGQNDVVASTDERGNLILSSATGADIVVDDTSETTGQGTLFTHLTYMNTFDVATTALTNGAGTVSGFLSLTSLDGSSIKISDGPRDSGTGTADTIIGFASTNEHGTTSKGVGVGTTEAASSSLVSIDAALDKIAQFRAGFGAYENRLDASINNLTTLQINTDAARSRIEDADFAKETTNMTKSQILSQAATSMLAQANSSKQNLLALLQG